MLVHSVRLLKNAGENDFQLNKTPVILLLAMMSAQYVDILVQTIYFMVIEFTSNVTVQVVEQAVHDLWVSLFITTLTFSLCILVFEVILLSII